MKTTILMLCIIFMNTNSKAQLTRDEDKTNYVVAGFHAGYNLKHPIAGLQLGYRFHNFYLSANDYIPVSSDATAPQIFGGSLGYNIGSFQPFISYAYHTIGREKDAYFGYSNAWHGGFGVSYYPTTFPLAFTVQRTGNKNIFSVTLYKAL